MKPTRLGLTRRTLTRITLALLATSAVAVSVIESSNSRPSAKPRTLVGAQGPTAGSQVGIAVSAGQSTAVPPLPSDNSTPPCPSPKPPAATFPTAATPGHYGIPFVASLTHGEVVFQYNESTNRRISSLPHGFNGKVFNITGWVTGLISLPTLQVSGAQVTFCTAAAKGQPGPIHFVEQEGTPAQIQNWDPSGSGYLNFTFLLTPVGTANLKVTGVAPDGSLGLAGSAEATTTVVAGPPFNETCRSSTPTNLSNLATSVAPMPPGGGPVTQPSPLTGPLSHGSAILGSDDFSVPAFDPASCILANGLFNQGLAGLNKNGKPNWPCTLPTQTHCPAVAAKPGWVQFFADTTIVQLGLPVGPPANFHF